MKRRADRSLLLSLALLLGALVWHPLPASADEPVTVAFYGFRLINTSLEATTPAEAQRLHMLDEQFRQISVPPDEAAKLAAGPEIGTCNACEADSARGLGAARAAYGEVQKVSNLILNINVYLEDAATGRVVFVKSTDIRGNTDDSWSRGLKFLVKNYLLEQ
jgi:Protein of unknown function (DUF2380)